MRKTIKVTGIELTPAISDYLEKKLTSLDKLIDPEDTSALAQVEIGKTTKHHHQGDLFRAEINLHIAGADFRVESEIDNLYAAIDVARDQMHQELQTFKRKKVSLIRRGGARVKAVLKGIYGSKK
jgi:ribosomal subunit interface protein